jgi:hypothetical protein
MSWGSPQRPAGVRRRISSPASDSVDVLPTSARAPPPSAPRTQSAVRDFSPLEPKVSELKFYAKGVGGVLSVDISAGDSREELVSFRRGK